MTDRSETVPPRYLKRPGAKEYEIDEDVMIHIPDSGGIVKLNGSARQIWELCAKPATAEEICAQLGRQYNAAEEVFREDVDQALAEFVKNGLISRTDDRAVL